MTRPSRAGWHHAWQLDPTAGAALHAPTGLTLRYAADVDGTALPAGWLRVASCALPAGVQDRRQADQIAPGALHAPEVRRWAILAPGEGPGSLPAARSMLEQQLQPHDVPMALARLLRQAGELWVYRERLDRQRPRRPVSAGSPASPAPAPGAPGAPGGSG